MANNPVATMTARVQIDKSEVLEEALKNLKDVQKTVDGNAIVYKLKSDKGSLQKLLKEIADTDLKIGADVIIESSAKDLQSQIKSLLGETKIEVDASSFENIDSEIKKVSSDLDAAKKKFSTLSQNNDLKSLKQRLVDINKELSKTSDKEYDKKAKEFLDVANSYRLAGGHLGKGADAALVSTYKDLISYYSKYKPKNLLGDPAEIAKAEATVSALTLKLTELENKKALSNQANQATEAAKSLEAAANKVSTSTDDISKANNEIEALLNKSFSTSGKTAASNQLKSAYEEYQKFFGEKGSDADKLVYEWSDAGREAGYNYAESLKEAIAKGVADSRLEKYIPDDIKYLLKQKSSENRIKGVDSAYEDVVYYLKERSRIIDELGSPILSESSLAYLQEYMHAFEQYRLASDNFTIEDEDSTNAKQYLEQRKKFLVDQIQYEKEEAELKKAISAQSIDAMQEESAAEQKMALTSQEASAEAVSAQEKIQNAVEETKASVDDLNSSLNNSLSDVPPISPGKLSGSTVKAPDLVQESTGQLALFDNIVEAENKIVEESKEVSNAIEQIQGQLSLDFTKLPDKVTQAYAQWAEELEKVDEEAKDVSTSIQEAINVSKAMDSGENRFGVDLLSELHDYELGITTYYENAAKQREAVLKTEQRFWENIYKRDTRNRNELTSLTTGTNGLRDESKYVSEIIDRANELSTIIRTIESQRFVNEEDLKRASQLLKQLKSDAALDENQLANPRKVANYIDTISQYMTKYTGLSQQTRDSLQQIINAFNDPKLTKAGANNLIEQFTRLRTAAREAGEETQSIFTTIGNRLRDMNAKFIAQFLSLNDIIRYIRTAAQAIIELDYALVDLKKTTTMSSSELKDFYYAANDVAKANGVTTKEIIDQAAAWSRLGYSSKEAATEMAALSSQFAAISPGMNLDQATDGLVSTMKAFHIDVANVEREAMDSINRIGNTMATSNDEVVEMLKRSSAAMAAANNTLGETIALESAAVQITRNAETTGTAFRTKNCPYVQQCA